MPRYDLECTKCCTRWEAICPIAERHQQRCECGGLGDTLLLQAPGGRVFDKVFHDPDTGREVEFGRKADAADWLHQKGLHSEGITHLYENMQHDGTRDEEKQQVAAYNKNLSEARATMQEATGKSTGTMVSRATVDDETGAILEKTPIGWEE